MSSRDINLLHPVLREKCLLFLSQCALAGLHPIITCTGRSEAVQQALYAQGRLPLAVVNQTRLAADMAPITDKENKKVTWTTKSKHIINPATGFCRAFDFCLTKNGKAHWDVKADIDGDEIQDYLEAALIGQELGLTSGAFWATPDWPHMELDT